MQTTVAGTVASWYYDLDDAQSPTPAAFLRAVSVSFGSVCFGSLLVALLRLVRFLLRQLMRDSNFFIRCVVDCILGCIQGLLELFNRYAFVFVGMYGCSYLNGGRRVRDMADNHLGSAIANGNLVAIDTFVGQLVVALIVGGACAGYTYAQTDGRYNWITAGVVGLYIGAIISYQVLNLIVSGVDGLYVCVVENPEVLETVDRDICNGALGTVNSDIESHADRRTAETSRSASASDPPPAAARRTHRPAARR